VSIPCARKCAQRGLRKSAVHDANPLARPRWARASANIGKLAVGSAVVAPTSEGALPPTVAARFYMPVRLWLPAGQLMAETRGCIAPRAAVAWRRLKLAHGADVKPELQIKP